LILAVDRDNDVGDSLGVKTPIVGRDNVLRTAIQYMLRRPDDSDGNAMFGAIQLYDQLSSSLGENNVEVAIVAGSSSQDVMANLKMIGELEQILSMFPADGAVIVSDGPSDEAIVPLIQSKVPVISVRRVVVKQSTTVEETAVLIGYYLRKLFTDPAIKKYSVVIPGVLLLFASMLTFLPPSVIQYFGALLSLLLGAVMIVYGLNLHVAIVRIFRRYEMTFFSIALAIVGMATYLSSGTPMFQGFPTIFDILGILVSIPIFVFAVESLVKYNRIKYGAIASATSILFFLLYPVKTAYYISVGEASIARLFWDLVVYTLVVFAITSVILLLKLKLRGEAKNRFKV